MISRISYTNGLIGFSVGVWSEARRRGIRIVHTLRDYCPMCLSSVMYRHERNCASICPRCLPFCRLSPACESGSACGIGVSEFILKRHMREGFFKLLDHKVIFNPLYPVQRRAGPPGRTRGLVFGLYWQHFRL